MNFKLTSAFKCFSECTSGKYTSFYLSMSQQFVITQPSFFIVLILCKYVHYLPDVFGLQPKENFLYSTLLACTHTIS